VAITVADDCCLALKSDGTVWGWGQNYSHGKLGIGTNRDPPHGTMVQVIGLNTMAVVDGRYQQVNDIVAIDGGLEHVLALKSDGSVWAWGAVFGGAAGLYLDNWTPIRIWGLHDVIAISAGDYFSLALKSDGTVWAWGGNSIGQLGSGTSSLPYNFAIQVKGLTDVIAIATGSSHSLALKSDGTVWAWGGNSNCQLGNENKEGSSIPIQVSGLTNVVGIAAGGRQSLAFVESTPTPTLTPSPTPTLTLTPTPTITSTPIPKPTPTLISTITTPVPTSPTLASTSTISTPVSTTTSLTQKSTTPTPTPTNTTTPETPSIDTGNDTWWLWLVSGLAVALFTVIILIRLRK